MPVAQTQEEKYINGIKCDKENETAFFNDETHSYYDKKTMQKGISVTTLVGKYCNEFNADFGSAVKAMERLLTPEDWIGLKPLLMNSQIWKDDYLDIYGVKKELFDMTRKDILDEWERKKNESCTKGTAKHLEKELSFYNRDSYDFAKYGAPEHKGCFTCKQDVYDFSLDRGVYPELFLSYTTPEGLFLNGQIDCCVKDGNEISIIDGKTNREIKKTSFYDSKRKKNVMMKFPLNNLQDSVWNHYQLQTSVYGGMLEQLLPGVKVKHLNIVHLKDDGSEEVMPCEYLKTEVEKMIKHYARMQKVNAALDELKPIVY